MKQNKRTLGIVLAICFQFLVLVGGYYSVAIILWSGKEIRLKTAPIDPRSMFRGNYARLNYDISRIGREEFPETKRPIRKGEIVYVQLKLIDDVYVYDSISFERPDSGVYVRGRVASIGYDTLRVKYGIEAFFAPKERALEIERVFSDEKAVAVLMINEAGKAVLKDVVSSNSQEQ